MIKKILDRYYLILLRGYDNQYGKDKLSYHVSGLISFILMINISSLIISFDRTIIFRHTLIFLASYLVMVVFIDIIIGIIYNKERRERLRKDFETESIKSRRCGAAWVAAYVIVSVILLIFAIFISEVPK